MKTYVSPIAAQALGMTPEEFAEDKKAMEAHELVAKRASRISLHMGTQATALMVAIAYDILNRTAESKPNATTRPAKGTRK